MLRSKQKQQKMENQNFITYYRVSTNKQGVSGLGLEAQKQSAENYIRQNNGNIIGSFTDIESGKKNDRPELMKAIQEAKKKNCKLLIAKLDRLSRNVSFIFALRDSGIDFACADMPEMNTLTIGIMATFAQYEREKISERTKEANRVKVERDGEFRKGRMTIEARLKGLEIRILNAKNNINKMKCRNYAKMLRESGKKLQQIADILNQEGHKTSKGFLFSPKSVQMLIAENY